MAPAATFAPTTPFPDGTLQRTQIEPTRPATAPQSRLPASAHLSPEITVMPPTPTMESHSAPRRTVWTLAGLGGVLAATAAAWALGGRPSDPLGAPRAATSTELIEPSPVQALVAASGPQASASHAALAAVAEPPRDKALRDDSRPRPSARPARPARSATAPAAVPATPREACGGRRFLALAACMEQQCETPRYRDHAQCESVRAMVQRRRLGDNVY